MNWLILDAGKHERWLKYPWIQWTRCKKKQHEHKLFIRNELKYLSLSNIHENYCTNNPSVSWLVKRGDSSETVGNAWGTSLAFVGSSLNWSCFVSISKRSKFSDSEGGEIMVSFSLGWLILIDESGKVKVARAQEGLRNEVITERRNDILECASVEFCSCTSCISKGTHQSGPVNRFIASSNISLVLERSCSKDLLSCLSNVECVNRLEFCSRGLEVDGAGIY